MSAAGEADNGGPVVDPDLVESAMEPEGVPLSNAVTQLIPIVNPTPIAVDPPVVRATARRAPAALPAIGRDGASPDLPKSARETIDRRRKADGEGSGHAAHGTGPDAEEPSEPVAVEPVAVEPVAVAEPIDAVAPPAAVAPAERAQPPEQARRPERVRLTEPAGPTPATLDQIEIDPSPESAARRDLVAAVIGLRDARTDEWLMPSESEPREPAPRPAPRPSPGPVRPGPVAIESDSWSATPSTESHADSYHGRRRAAAPARMWLVIGVVLVGLGSAVAIPIALRSAPPAVTASPTAANVALAPAETSTESATISGTSSAAASPSQSPTPKPVPPVPPPSPSPPPTVSPPPPFAPLSLEAEDAQRGGSAAPRSVSGASNGVVVGTLGDRGSTPDGWARFSLTAPAAGQYAVAVYYTFSDGTNRDAYVNVNTGAAAIHNFLRSPTCPCASKTITVTLAAGANTIEFGNPNAAAPSIDRVVITKP